MKKLLALTLALIALVSFAACVPEEKKSGEAPETGTEKNTQQGASPAETTGEGTLIPGGFDLGSVLAGNGATDTVWGKQDDAIKQQIIAEGKKDGVEVSFGADGSMTVVDPESGETVIQNPDGTWSIKGEDGSIGQYGGNWPENEFTKLLPKPDLALLAATTNEDSFTVGFLNATIEGVKAYVEQVKAKGFTLDAQTEDQKVGELVIYNYTAKNDAGYTVSVSFAMGTSAILVEKS